MRALSTNLLSFHGRLILKRHDPREEPEMTRKPPYYRLHIDLLRVSSALCPR
ncbi:putative leader peptide [Kribbella solani]|uniref:putative leader peptide n=1 Tax=Kribbella solani TaxID=236067 RepID=UPI0038D4F046